MGTPRDPNTLSNYHEVRTTHVEANFEVDFEKKQLLGFVQLELTSLIDGLKQVVLDTSYLDIKEVQIDGVPVSFEHQKRSEPYGSPLIIPLSSAAPKDSKIILSIKLNTTSECTALQWLSPEQTSNKKHPYMFSQCQAIHARSIFPCQDTPDVKATVDFRIRSRLPVVASGLPAGNKDYQPDKAGGAGTLLYTFKQEIPIPSYLFAIASGDVASASIGPRSSVWTGPEELVGCQWEFEADMERFMDAAESLVYPYAWTQYNVLVLPPSFPYGGMENPVFTFATPTVVSKDRQNIDVIAHELSHSWSGNLVSNASWEHFWLNEGWTTYLERRIQATIHGEAHRGFSAIIGWKALQDSVKRFGEEHEFTKLVVNLKDKDPDDAFSSVPYEKGFVFLYHLEKLIGKEKWDSFIPHYFEKYRQKSLDSFEFKATLLEYFAKDTDASGKLEKLDWDSWFYSPGYPPKPDYDDSLVKVCYELASAWESRVKGSQSATDQFKPKESDIEGWVSNQSVVFLERLQDLAEPLSADDIELMGSVYKYDRSANVELVSRYFVLGLRSRCKKVYQPTAELLGKVGRMKFTRALYKCLNEADRELALKTFEENKDFYHPICRQSVEKILFGS